MFGLVDVQLVDVQPVRLTKSRGEALGCTLIVQGRGKGQSRRLTHLDLVRFRATECPSAARSVVETAFAVAYFEAIAAVDGLDIKHIACRHSKHALDGSRHLFVHAVRKFDHDNRSLARRTYQPTTDGPGALTYFPEDDLHLNNYSYDRAFMHAILRVLALTTGAISKPTEAYVLV